MIQMDKKIMEYKKAFAASGGKARAKKLPKSERVRIARMGGKARWAKREKS